ncbi:phage portal protein [Oscillospiraceae bacterium 38-13]
MTDIVNILKSLGYYTVPASFYGDIAVWKSWYDGNVRSFHRYQVYNGIQRVDCRRYSMGMAKKVAEDWANLLLNEKVKITLEGTAEQKFFDSVCKKNNFAVKSNEMQELKAALGTAAYVVRASGVSVGNETGNVTNGEGAALKVDYVAAPNIFPLSWENGTVKECAFSSAVMDGGKEYTYLQIHRKGEDGNYIVENRLYQSGTKAEPSTVKSMVNVPPVVHTNSPTPQFVIDRLNIVNNVDNTLPMGIPAFANAIDQLKGVDVAYDSYVNEFVLGKKRVMVRPGAVKDLDGNPVFDPSELYYYVLPEDTVEGNIIQPIDMTLRTAEHNAGLQDMLNALSSRCGFGENHYRFDSGSVATATQVISENSTMFRTIKKHEIVLEQVLTELCRIILRLGNSVMGMGLNEDVEISIDFDDSIIEDRKSELQEMRADVAAGLIRGELYVAKKYGVTENEAKKMMPSMEDMTDEEQDELE